MSITSDADSKQRARRVEQPSTKLCQPFRRLGRPELRSSDIAVSSIVGPPADDPIADGDETPSLSILLMLQGCGDIGLEDTELTIYAGEAAIFRSERPDAQLHVTVNKPIEAVEFRFAADFARSMARTVLATIANTFCREQGRAGENTFLVAIPLSASLLDVARTVLDCNLPEGRLRDVFMRAKALEALAVTLASLLTRAEPAATSMSPKDKERIDKARRLIETAYADPWTIESLASAVGVSETKLKAGFRTILGKSVRSYLRDTRMDRAASLLAQGKSVTEVAFSCGYTNLSYFSKAFLSSKGMSPRRLQAHCADRSVGRTVAV